MKLTELSTLLGLSPEELVAKAKEFGVDLVQADGHVDPEIVQLLKQELGVGDSAAPVESATS